MVKKFNIIIFFLELITICITISIENHPFLLNKTTLQNRILGGDELTEPNKYPFHVALKFLNGKEEIAFCGGSIISEKFVMTAAHCVDDKNLIGVQVLFGAHDLRKNNEEEKSRIEKYVSRENFIIHPKWNRRTLENDIALIRINVPLNDNVKEIQICCDSNPTNYAITTGWGQTSSADRNLSPVLREVTLKIITNSKCKLLFPATSSNICVSGINLPKKGTCNGDSGGPLFTKTTNLYDCQIGLTSFGAKNCDTLFLPSAFTRLYDFLDFIKKETEVECVQH